MAASSRVIELVFKLRDQLTAPLRALQGRVGQALKFGLAIGGAATIGAAFNKMLTATREAEDALASFDLAFKNFGSTVGKSRQEMIKFADDASKRTIFDDESIIKAQASLLKFRSITGPVFTQARQATLDLASAMRIDLESAANIVGRAIERPSIALRQLRQVGIIFSASQEKVIKQLEATGQRSRAAAILLEELQRKVKGASDKMAGTLSGTLARVKTAFDNLFESGPENTQKMTDAFNELAKTLNSEEVKSGIANLVTGMATLVSWAVKAAAAFGTLGKAIADFVVSPTAKSATLVVADELDAQFKLIKDLEKRAESKALTMLFERQTGKSLDEEIAKQKAYLKTLEQRFEITKQLDIAGKNLSRHAIPGRSGGDRGVSSTESALLEEDLESLEEVGVNTFRTLSREVEALYATWRKESLSQIDLDGQAFEQRILQLNALKAAGKISAEEYTRAFDEALEDGLEEVKVTVKPIVRAVVDPIDEQFKKVATSIADNLADAISIGGFHGMTTLKEIMKQTLRGIIADIIRSGLKSIIIAFFKSIKNAVTGGGGGFFGGGGFLGSVFGAIGKIFGFAGGGRGRGLAMVGEEGPELVNLGAGSMVYNRRMLESMGMGSLIRSIVHAPQIHMTVNGDPDRNTLRMIFEGVEVALARNQRETIQLVRDGGARRR